MQNHWPVLIAAVLISIAVGLGLYRRDQIIEAATHRNPIPVTAPTPAPAAPPANVSGKAEAELPAPSAATATPPAAQPAPKTPAVAVQPNPAAVPPSPKPLPLDPKAIAAAAPAPAQPVQPARPAAQPAGPASKFILPSNAPAAQPAQAVQPAKPAAPAVAVSNGAQILFDLRQKIEAAMGRKSTDLATGGYAFQLDQARVEVQPMPSWSIKVYNLAQPADNESDAFKKVLTTIGTEIGFDATQKGTTLSSGKLSMQAATKLGHASIVRDPQSGEVVITPNQRKVIQPAAPVAPAPAAPAAPTPAAGTPAPATPGAPQTQGNTGPASAPGKQF